MFHLKRFTKFKNSPNVLLRKTDVVHVVLKVGNGCFIFIFMFIFVFTEELIIIFNLIETLNKTLLNGLK